MNLFSKYKARLYAVAFDNDTQPFFYRGDLMDDPEEKAKRSRTSTGRRCARR